ncbi:MAG: hypothetical protein ABFD60_01725 [Bryobacteraceae bacterium]
MSIETGLSWRAHTVIRILLLVAKWFAEDDAVKQEIHALSNHINFCEPR